MPRSRLYGAPTGSTRVATHSKLPTPLAPLDAPGAFASALSSITHGMSPQGQRPRYWACSAKLQTEADALAISPVIAKKTACHASGMPSKVVRGLASTNSCAAPELAYAGQYKEPS